MVKKIAILTAGGLAPCLSSATGGLIQRYTEMAPGAEVIAHKHGYQGLLQDDYFVIDETVRVKAHLLYMFGDPPVGNSRAKFTNIEGLVKHGLITEEADPLKVAASRLVADDMGALRTVGGDDASTTAIGLATFLATDDYLPTMVGLSKTIDNDVIPVRQSLGARTAAEQGTIFAENIITEHSSGSRMLIVHEVMGRHCGWLTTVTAAGYRRWLDTQGWLPRIGSSREAWNVHVVHMPETVIDITAEAEHLNKVMDEVDSVIVFLSEGVGLGFIVAEMEVAGEEVSRDPFGHMRFDKVNPGKWLGGKLAEKLGAEKAIIQKSGYFPRSAVANEADLALTRRCIDLAVDYVLAGCSGVISQGEGNNDKLMAITFGRIKSGRPSDIILPRFTELVATIG